MTATASPSRPAGGAAPTDHEPLATAAPAPIRRGGRWPSLDALRGIALFAMVAHHLAEWGSRGVRHRWIGFEGFAVTDLAAPMFALGLGSAAYLVGTRVVVSAHPVRVVWSVVGKWIKVLLVAMALELGVQGRLDGGGVLYTLFVIGLLTTGLVAAGLRSPWAWWAIAAVCAGAAGPVQDGAPPAESALEQLWTGGFALTTYLAFAAAGAAVVAAAGRGGEAALPLWRSAAAVLAGGTLLSLLVPATAPEGLWPPSRHPGDLAYTVWGTAATLAVWGVLRAVLRPGAITDGLARAGQRTLLVFGAHYCIKIVVGRAGLLGSFDTRAWGLATWAVTVAICVAATLPTPAAIRGRRRRPT